MGYRQTHADAGLGGVSGVVSSLPAGYVLGEERQEKDQDGNIQVYRLVYNAGGEQAGPGYFMQRVGSAGPFSMTVTTVSKTHAHIGAVLVEHATATTGTYFWGLVRGRSAQGVVGDASSIPTGSAFYIASDGQAELMPQSVVTGNTPVGVNLGGAATKTVTTGALSGDPYINLN